MIIIGQFLLKNAILFHRRKFPPTFSDELIVYQLKQYNTENLIFLNMLTCLSRLATQRSDCTGRMSSDLAPDLSQTHVSLLGTSTGILDEVF